MLRVFENRELRRIFRPNRDEMSGEWRKIHNEELNDPYSSLSIVRGDKIEMDEMEGACSAYGVHRVLVGKPEGRRPLGRPRRRWEDYIETDLQELGCRGMDWIELAQDRDRWRRSVNAVKILRVP